MKGSKIVLYVAYYFCIGKANSVVSNEVNYLVKELCGGEQTCVETNGTFAVDSCCRPCECSEICEEKGTCCDGSRTTRFQNVTAQVCLQAGREGPTGRGNVKFNPYFVRAHCPKSSPDQITRGKCETLSPESLEDIVFVSSKNGKVVYKNRHCAACHGEVDPVMWTMGVDDLCIRDVFLSASDPHRSLNASYINEKLMASCTIKFDRPTITSWKHVACAHEEVLISSCPEVTSQNLSSADIDKELNEL